MRTLIAAQVSQESLSIKVKEIPEEREEKWTSVSSTTAKSIPL